MDGEGIVNDIAQARARRDLGMARAADKAEREVTGWSEVALAFVRRFVSDRPHPFLAEDVRAAAKVWGLIEPQNAKAWGPVIKRAERAGVVRACGYAPANSSNRSPKVLWRRA